MGKLDQFMIDGTTYEIVPEIAPLFNESDSYSVGDYVIKDAVLYRFTSNHTGAWTGADVEVVTVGNELTDLKADLRSALNVAGIKNLIGGTKDTLYPVYIPAGTQLCASIASGVAISDKIVIYLYRANKTILDHYNLNAGNVYRIFTTPSSDTYFVGYTSSAEVTIQLEVGSSPTEYTEYLASLPGILAEIKAIDEEKADNDKVSTLQAYANLTGLKNMIGSETGKLYPVYIPANTPLCASISTGVAVGNNIQVRLYDVNGAQLNFFSIAAGNVYRAFTSPSSDTYYVSYTSIDNAIIQLEAGTQPSDFAEYVTSIQDILTRIESLDSTKANESSVDALSSRINTIIGVTKNLFSVGDVIIGTNHLGRTGYPQRATTVAYTGGSLGLTISTKTLPSNLKYEVDGYTDIGFNGINNYSAGWVTESGKKHTVIDKPYVRILFGSVDGTNLEEEDFDGLEMQIEVGSVQTSYVPHDTAVDYVARDSNSFPVHLKVCSYNIGEYSYGVSSDTPPEDAISNLIAFLSAYDFDIVGVQEGRTVVNGEQINDTVYNDYFHSQINMTNNACLKSQYELIEAGTGRLTEDDRPYVYGNIRVGGKEVYVMNVHLGLYENVRKANYTELLAILAQHDRFIVFGDFNAANEFSSAQKAGQAQEEYDNLIDAGYTVANGGRWGLLNTYGTTVNYRDNICVSANIKMISAKVLQIYDSMNSDHLPLMAELVI